MLSKDNNGNISTSTRLIEMLAVVVTGIAKFVMINHLNQKFWFVTIACVFWLGYILYRISRNPGLPEYWGFRKEGFKRSLKIVLPLSIIAILTFATIGDIAESLVFNWHIIPILILYPLWGTIQQFMIIGLLARNLTDFENMHIPKTVVVFLSATVFSVVHLPSVALVVATFFLALFYTVLYLKYRNLWILGIFHGWLGCFFYFFILGRDPWLEFIQAIQ